MVIKSIVIESISFRVAGANTLESHVHLRAQYSEFSYCAGNVRW